MRIQLKSMKRSLLTKLFPRRHSKHKGESTCILPSVQLRRKEQSKGTRQSMEHVPSGQGEAWEGCSEPLCGAGGWVKPLQWKEYPLHGKPYHGRCRPAVMRNGKCESPGVQEEAWRKNLSKNMCMELGLHGHHSRVQAPSPVAKHSSTCSYTYICVYMYAHILCTAQLPALVALVSPSHPPQTLWPQQPCGDPSTATGPTTSPTGPPPCSACAGEILPHPATASFIISAQLWFISCLNLF